MRPRLLFACRRFESGAELNASSFFDGFGLRLPVLTSCGITLGGG